MNSAPESELMKTILNTYGNSNLPDTVTDYLSQTAAKRGNSGADIAITHDCHARKTGPPNTVLGARVVSQGQWIKRHSNPALPRVHDVFKTDTQWGYTMEILDTVPLELLDGQKLVAAMVQLLHDHFWHKPSEVEFDREAHEHRLAPITGPLSGREREIFYRLFEAIDWANLTGGLTHGDPVFQNVLFRQDSAIVLVDPIPATPGVPDLIAVDVAHIFMSCVGYERLTYDLPASIEVSLDSVASMASLTQADMIASLYFAVMSVLRAMVYVPTSTAKILLDECVGQLIGEATCHL
ncbi:hypothetical protein [Amycolatopsis sp. NPDC049868]|uniref:hypothetical protein n=1 Tax=Amycolatopsis sp. NPDC049868 TaxID=3363934 RepID=UPI0037A7AFDD